MNVCLFATSAVVRRRAYALSPKCAGRSTLSLFAMAIFGLLGSSGCTDGLSLHAPVTVSSTTRALTVSAPIKINFQADTSATPSGYIADTGEVFGARGNDYTYGWDVDRTGYARDIAVPVSVDARHQTFNHLEHPDGSFGVWEIALPPGYYHLHAVAGDPRYVSRTYLIDVEGAPFIDTSTVSNQRWVSGSGIVAVTDGRLTISNGASATTENKLSFLHITPVDAAPGGVSAAVNFEQVATSTPAGYTSDIGAVFVAPYGWDADNADNARTRTTGLDYRYSTLNHLQRNGDFTWEYAVANGTYAVHLVAGDPDHYGGTRVYSFDIEGQEVIDGDGSTNNIMSSREMSAIVEVLDGRLTVTSGATASANKIQFIEIQQLEAIPPLYVDDDFSATNCDPGLTWDVSCFAELGRALQVAGPLDTIVVYSGTYTEQLTIAAPATIRGVERDGGGPPVIQPPAVLTATVINNRNYYNLVTIDGSGGSVSVAVDNVTLQGPFSPQTNTYLLNGILVREAHAELSNSRLYEMSDGLHSSTRGAAILVGHGRNSVTGTATIRGNTVGVAGGGTAGNFLKSGIVASGRGSHIAAYNNAVYGDGSNARSSQNAFEVSSKAAGQLSGNSAENARYWLPFSGSAQGIYISDTAGEIFVQGNDLRDNQHGIEVNSFTDSGDIDTIDVTIDQGNILVDNDIGIHVVERNSNSVNPIDVDIRDNDISDYRTGTAATCIRVVGYASAAAVDATVNNNNFESDELANDIGLDNASPFAMDATDNWWGDASGPRPGGQGLEAIGLQSQEYTPFSTAPN